MKREIKFRGKRLDTGEWIYGDLIRNVEDAFAIVPPFGISTDRLGEYEVHEETIGQFTGLQDKNGKEVYEDDFVRIPATMLNAEIIGVVKYEKGSFFVRSIFSGCSSDLGWVFRERMVGEPTAQIIGNIYDDSELLKGGK